MANFIGEFECKLDTKGRLMLPSGLRKQLDPAAQEKFVLNRVLKNVWCCIQKMSGKELVLR